ncbi:MAG: LysR family transcriptional regulator [Desulfomonile tiedjei]|uniref:LysR family transcriptional regulator n=1 Tax=Desulfomonile tiedjei TaxID=2358 RepID=A0A9D6V3D7_9BACT|nr:LysR family transcriptional regulator [Desulfomonile tiedjei]
MEIRHLKTFLTVAKLLSFNRAAERLNYAQSSISAQVQALEAELGVQLFDRLGRRILLTEAGERLIQYAEKIIDLADETRAEISVGGQPEGSLTIRIPESLGVHRLPPAIKEFSSRFPRISLNFTTCAHESLQKDLRTGVTDLAFLLAESYHSAGMEAETVGFESIVLVASPSHRLAKEKLVRTKDLWGDVVLLSKVDCSYRRLFESMLEEERIHIESKLIFQSIETLKRCVIAGVGITVLPEVSVCEEIRRGELVPIAWDVGKLEVAVLMIWSKGRWLSPSLLAFLEISRKVLRGSSH